MLVAAVYRVKVPPAVVISLRAVFSAVMKRAERDNPEIGSRIGQVMHLNGL
jgi:hypothetical protein